jgi:hypothetical protein
MVPKIGKGGACAVSDCNSNWNVLDKIPTDASRACGKGVYPGIHRLFLIGEQRRDERKMASVAASQGFFENFHPLLM